MSSKMDAASSRRTSLAKATAESGASPAKPTTEHSKVSASASMRYSSRSRQGRGDGPAQARLKKGRTTGGQTRRQPDMKAGISRNRIDLARAPQGAGGGR